MSNTQVPHQVPSVEPDVGHVHHGLEARMARSPGRRLAVKRFL
jgi:hypothetical protein